MELWNKYSVYFSPYLKKKGLCDRHVVSHLRRSLNKLDETVFKMFLKKQRGIDIIKFSHHFHFSQVNLTHHMIVDCNN